MKVSTIRLYALFFLSLSIHTVHAQNISGKLSEYPSKKLVLFGFNGLSNLILDSTNTNKDGSFALTFNPDYVGNAVLKDEYNNSLFLILTEHQIELVGTALMEPTEIQVTKGDQNKKLQEYLNDYPLKIRELSALSFLKASYQNKTGKAEKTFLKNIDIQIEAISKPSNKNKLATNRHLDLFIETHFFIRQILSIPPKSAEDRSTVLRTLRSIDLSNRELYTSGLLSEVLESHIMYIESSFEKIEEIYLNFEKSIDIILQNTQENDILYNDVVNYLFNLFERRSLTVASEYLALKVLNNNACYVNDYVSNQLEAYRKLAVGAIAPDIEIGAITYSDYAHQPSKLSEIRTDYTLIIFAAGWCHHCLEEIPKILPLYDKWKRNGIEVLLISLDDNPKSFAEFAAPLPFISTTDYKKWEGQTVKDYHVFGTPTMLLVNKERKIIQKITSVQHMDAWVNWFFKAEKQP